MQTHRKLQPIPQGVLELERPSRVSPGWGERVRSSCTSVNKSAPGGRHDLGHDALFQPRAIFGWLGGGRRQL